MKRPTSVLVAQQLLNMPAIVILGVEVAENIESVATAVKPVVT